MKALEDLIGELVDVYQPLTKTFHGDMVHEHYFSIPKITLGYTLNNELTVHISMNVSLSLVEGRTTSSFSLDFKSLVPKQSGYNNALIDAIRGIISQIDDNLEKMDSVKQINYCKELSKKLNDLIM